MKKNSLSHSKYSKKYLGYLEGSISAIVNIFLFALKLWVGITTGSIAMIADAWHTLSDTITSGIVIISFWVSTKPKDKEHPFGHGRSELICAIVIGTLLGVVGLNFIKESIQSLFTMHTVQYGKLIIIVSAATVVIKEALARFSIWAGEKINSKSLIADGWHHRSDAATSLLIIIGAFIGKYFWWVDSSFGIIIAITILYTAYNIIKSSATTLLGEYANKKLVAQIQKIIIKNHPEVSNIHHIHIHSYGDHTELTMHLKLPGSYSLIKAHAIVTNIENILKETFQVEPTIHIEPK